MHDQPDFVELRSEHLRPEEFFRTYSPEWGSRSVIAAFEVSTVLHVADIRIAAHGA